MDARNTTLIGLVPAILAVAGVGAPATAPMVPNAVVFWDAQRGLLGSGTAIELTTDGGRTFHVVFRTPRAVIGLQTAGADGAIARTDGGDEYRTLDGGSTWRPFATRKAASFATPLIGLGWSTHFTNDHLALAVYATRDGGRTWRRRTSPCSRSANSAVIDLVTPRLGWIVCLGEPGAGNQEKAVFRTVDGGVTWQHRFTADAAISSYGYPYGISFAPDGFGLLWEGRGTLYVTRDGGLGWAAEPSVAAPEVDWGRGASAFAHGVGFVLLGRGGGLPARLLETHDAGRSWTVVRVWT